MEEIHYKAIKRHWADSCHWEPARVNAEWFDDQGRKHIKCVAICESEGSHNEDAELIARALNSIETTQTIVI